MATSLVVALVVPDVAELAAALSLEAAGGAAAWLLAQMQGGPRPS